jgi:hypothetical protein
MGGGGWMNAYGGGSVCRGVPPRAHHWGGGLRAPLHHHHHRRYMENALRGLFFFSPGRFRESELAIEFGGCTLAPRSIPWRPDTPGQLLLTRSWGGG